MAPTLVKRVAVPGQWREQAQPSARGSGRTSATCTPGRHRPDSGPPFILFALVAGAVRSTHQTAQFQEAVTIAGLTLTAAAAALVGWGIVPPETPRTASQLCPSTTWPCQPKT